MSDRVAIALHFGQNVRRCRVAKGMTQGQLAGLSGLSRVYISDLERGEGNISLTCLVQLAKGLGTTAAHLIEGVEALQPSHSKAA